MPPERLFGMDSPNVFHAWGWALRGHMVYTMIVWSIQQLAKVVR